MDRTYDSNWIFNSVYSQSGASFNTRIDTNNILNAVYDTTNNALKVNVLGLSLTGNTTSTIPGANILTGASGLNQIVSVESSPSFDGLTSSGSTKFTSLATTGDTIVMTHSDGTLFTENPVDINDIDIYIDSFSANTIYSGSTDLYDIFLTSADGNDITRVQPGTYITTGGTPNNPTVNLASDINLTTISAGTIYSGSTDLYSIFLTSADGNDITRVQPGTYITTGGSANNPTVNLAADINLTSLSAATLYSGSTNLYDIFLTSADGNDITRVQPGTYITTGGTPNNPTVNLASNVNLTTLSAGTLYSGSTELGSLFAKPADIVNYSSQLATKASLSAATFTNTVTIPIATSSLSGAGFVSQGFAISDETTVITSGATAKLTYYAPFAFTITGVYACLTTTGSTLTTIDVHNAGTTIFSTKITIDAGEYETSTAAAAAVVSSASIAAFSKVEFYIDGAGTNATGAKVFINGYKS